MHIDSNRSHRTALFVDTRAVSDEFEQRSNRLLQSLNGDNIKVDVFSVTGTNGGGVVRVSGQPGSLAVASDPTDLDASELSAWARDQGYVQVLFSVPAGVELV